MTASKSSWRASIVLSLYFILIAAAYDDSIAERLLLLAISWAVTLAVVWRAGVPAGLSAGIIGILGLALASDLPLTAKAAAVMGGSLGSLDEVKPRMARILAVVGIVTASLVDLTTAAIVGGCYLSGAYLTRRTADLLTLVVTTFARIRSTIAAIATYVVMYLGYAVTAALFLRASDHGADQLQFKGWVAKELPPVARYVYFTLTAALAGPPPDVEIVGAIARFVVAVGVIVGVLFGALILRELFEILPVFQRSSSDRPSMG